MFQCCLNVNWINFKVDLQLCLGFKALLHFIWQSPICNYMIKEIFQFDECYLVKGRASNNDATNNNTEKRNFFQTRWLSLSKSNLKHSTMRIMQCNLCKILFFKNYAIVIYAQFPFSFQMIRMHSMHLLMKWESTLCILLMKENALKATFSFQSLNNVI